MRKKERETPACGRQEEEVHQEKIVFGLYKRDGHVYTVSVCDTKTYTLYNIIKEKVTPDSIVYTDLPAAGRLDVSVFQHYRINHTKAFVKHSNHINGIENFWS